jgi:hypothetical protein
MIDWEVQSVTIRLGSILDSFNKSEELPMSGRMTWLFGIVVVGTGATAAGAEADEPAKAKKPTADDVAKLWSPELKSATAYGQTGGSPKQSPTVAAYSFRVVGPSFEELWNHYAKLCGLKERYAEKKFLITTDAGPNGSYVVSDQATADGKGGRGLSVFLLKTDSYTATVTFHIDTGGKSISGSLSAVVP